eukprot:TRINITY_DN32222_c0_g1_i1.p1 TRINITY_DN32222_c0_g1~~TRINITY_DN32222_c0_g1_i1.p1  ORF type:complete len:771 (+),score=268.65 TRINITY_DN32222_c0_g1_i1:100-2412(+)
MPAGGKHRKARASHHGHGAALEEQYVDVCQELMQFLLAAAPGADHLLSTCCEFFARKAEHGAAGRVRGVWNTLAHLVGNIEALTSFEDDDMLPPSDEVEYTVNDEEHIGIRAAGTALFLREGSDSERRVHRLVYRGCTRRGLLGLDADLSDNEDNSSDDGVAACDVPVMRAPHIVPALVKLAEKCGVKVAGKDAFLDAAGGKDWGVAMLQSWAAGTLRGELRRCRRDELEDDDASSTETSGTECTSSLSEQSAVSPPSLQRIGMLVSAAGLIPPDVHDTALVPQCGMPRLNALIRASAQLHLQPSLSLKQLYAVSTNSLGRGSFGTVREGVCRIAGRRVAIKRSDTDDAPLVDAPGAVRVGSKVRFHGAALVGAVPVDPSNADVLLCGTVRGLLPDDEAAVLLDEKLPTRHFVTPPPVVEAGDDGQLVKVRFGDLTRVAPREVWLMERIGRHEHIVQLLDWRAGRYSLSFNHTVHLSVLRSVVRARADGMLQSTAPVDLAGELGRLREDISDRRWLTSHGVDSDDSRTCIVLELASGGDLSSNCQKVRRLMTKAGVWGRSIGTEVLRQAAEGLAAVHAAGIIHHDVKPDAFLLKRPLPSPDRHSHADPVDYDGRVVHVLLADFGASKPAGNVEVLAAALDYRSPELLCARDNWKSESHWSALSEMMRRPVEALADGRGYSPLTDVWSLGCVFYRLSSARRAFPDQWSVAQERIAQHRQGPNFSEDCWDDLPEVKALVTRMLSFEAHDRPTAAEVAKLLWSIRPVAKTWSI